MQLQGTLRRVAAEVEVQVRELTALLKERVMAQSDDAAECIGLIRRLGGPVADLQVPAWPLDCQNPMLVPEPGCGPRDVTTSLCAERGRVCLEFLLIYGAGHVAPVAQSRCVSRPAGRVPAGHEGQPRRFPESGLCSARALR
jgi:hypothetical protein